MSDNHFHISMKRRYWFKFHDGNICYKKARFDCCVCSINKRVYYCNGPVRMGSQLMNWFIQNKHCIAFFTVDWCVCLPSFHTLTCWTRFCAWLLPDLLFPHSSNSSICYSWSFNLVLLWFFIWMNVINTSAWYFRYIYIYLNIYILFRRYKINT